MELPLALNNNIPVLPIMMENGLGYRFSNTCAKIQVVPKYGTDPTAIPYDEVLQTFLDSILVGDELAEQVRSAFDAYVFLSYRKKENDGSAQHRFFIGLAYLNGIDRDRAGKSL